MRYAVLDGGKRIRPLLAYAAGELAQAPWAALDAVALALEYVHAYSLVHDDMPCMDDDVLRRGKPTVHVAFDEATAMLAGDALQAEAFRILADAPAPVAVRLELIQALAGATGTEGMCGGQAIDLAALGKALDAYEIERMHRMKTGALLRAAVLMGARVGHVDPPVLAALERYAEAIGLAFQIVDDILDVESNAVELGKTVGKDQAQNKSTYVSVLGMTAAKQRAAQLLRNARSSPWSRPACRRCAPIGCSNWLIHRRAAQAEAQRHRIADEPATARTRCCLPASIRPSRSAPPGPRAAGAAGRGTARLPAAFGGQHGRPPEFQPGHGRAGIALHYVFDTPSRSHRLGRRPPDLCAQDPDRPARGDEDAAPGRRHFRASRGARNRPTTPSARRIRRPRSRPRWAWRWRARNRGRDAPQYRRDRRRRACPPAWPSRRSTTPASPRTCACWSS